MAGDEFVTQISPKWQRFFRLLTGQNPSPESDAPNLAFETMGTVNVNTVDCFESIRLRLGEENRGSPKTGRPTPCDVRSRGFNVAYHTHFYDPKRVFNVPTVQDILMFVVYNAVSRYFCKLDPTWGVVREVELVITDLGVYVISLAKDAAVAPLPDLIVASLDGATVHNLRQANPHLEGSDLIEQAVYQSAASCLKHRGGQFCDRMLGEFEGLTDIDSAPDTQKVPFMQEEAAHAKYLRMFRLVGVDVRFRPWTTDGSPIGFKLSKTMTSAVSRINLD